MNTITTIHASTSPQILLVFLGVPERNATIRVPEDSLLNATYFNTFSRERMRETQIPVKKGTVLHLAAAPIDKFPGWFYVAYWDRKAQQYQCSCYERKFGDCLHCIALSEPAIA